VGANSRANSSSVQLQDYDKVSKILADLQRENNSIRPKFQELVTFKINAERKIHELKEELIRADLADPNSNS